MKNNEKASLEFPTLIKLFNRAGSKKKFEGIYKLL